MAVAKRKPARKKAKLSRLHQPADLSLEEWQTELRREYGQTQSFKLNNLGTEPVFSEFAVTNPESQKSYRVSIRGESPGGNYCSCPDFAVNTLGTCKHIEFTLGKLRRRHARVLRKGHTPLFSEVYVRYGTQRTVMFSAGEECPGAMQRLALEYFGLDGVLNPSAVSRFDTFARKATAHAHEVKIHDDALALIAEMRDDRRRKAKLQKKYQGRGTASAWKRLLKVGLFPYQRQGALFAAMAGRSIIADEMGLGKTIEAIGAAEILAKNVGVERALIVCPASLKHQWMSEIQKFSTREATIIEGQTHRRKALYGDESFFKIVNYDVVHRDLEGIAAWHPDLVILDEAQRIKNWQTRTAKSIKQIESPYAMVLTGTPLENRLDELHSIVEFVDRHRLGPLFAFKAAHEIREEDSAKVIGYQDLKKIKKTLAPILIRRTKDEVLKQLPPRMDKNIFVEMTDPQWVPHNENKELVARLVAKWRRYKFLSESDQLRLRIALQYMRMACDSTYLVDHQTKHGTKVGELCTQLSEVFEDGQAKAVVFSQWVRMNELVAEMFEQQGWDYVHLHGGVPSRDRKKLTQAFRENKDCRVFLSSDAGGVGLNLQSASTIVNMDLPWNPAVLEQRIGRVHRLGQERPVRVINFVSERTIEHGMLSLLSFKQSMFSGVLDGTADKVHMGEGALARFVKTVETATSSVPPPPAGTREAVTSSISAVPAGIGETAGPERQASTGSTPAMPEINLGQLLSQGAELLQALGRTLTDSSNGNGGHNGNGAASHPRIAVDSETGRKELRITLPDEKTLQQGVTQIAEVLRGLMSSANR